MTLRELHTILQTSFDALKAVRGNAPDDASTDTCFAVGEALGTIGRAKALVGRDIDNAAAQGEPT